VPGSKSVDKATRAARRRRLRNRIVQSRTKTGIKKANRLIGAGELEAAEKEVLSAVSSIDRAVSKGVFHRNKGARLKSRIVRKLNAIAAVGASSDSGEGEENPA
jgi:small subunit ribosomal protein S20